MPQYSKAQWDALGRLMGIYAAIDAVGPRIADIQKWLKENPVTVKPRKWRRW